MGTGPEIAIDYLIVNKIIKPLPGPVLIFVSVGLKITVLCQLRKNRFYNRTIEIGFVRK